MAQSGFDRRRVNGPEESIKPIFDDDDDILVKGTLGKREGRSSEDIRPICASMLSLS